MNSDIDCDLLKDFIDDNSDIAFLYMLKQEKDDCIEMYEFVEEMHLIPKFLLYTHMRANMN